MKNANSLRPILMKEIANIKKSLATALKALEMKEESKTLVGGYQGSK